MRELRPVPRLRRARGNLPQARRGAVVKKGQLESHLLVLVTMALVAFGLVMVYSSTSAPAALARTDPMSYLKKQGVYALIGVALMISASRFDYRRLRLLAPALVLTALGGCLAVLVIGSRINGARRWIEFGPATLDRKSTRLNSSHRRLSRMPS